MSLIAVDPFSVTSPWNTKSTLTPLLRSTLSIFCTMSLIPYIILHGINNPLPVFTLMVLYTPFYYCLIIMVYIYLLNI